MRLLLIGDVHAEDERLEWILAGRAGIDRVLCVGDIVDGPGDAARCVELLDAAGAEVVRGNHDRWAIAANAAVRYPYAVVSWLARLPTTRVIDTPLGSLLLCHGVGGNDMCQLEPDHVGYALESNFELEQLIRDGRHRLVVGGHTHRRMVRTFEQLTVINAGTLLRDHDPVFGILDCKRACVEFYSIADRVPVARSLHPLPR